MQNVKCPKCGAENELANNICSECQSEIVKHSSKTETFIHNPKKTKTEPQIDIDGLKKGESSVLVVKKGPILGQRLPLNEDEILIGRDPKADIFLNDITVSRRHAKIVKKDSEITVKDLGSLNGSYVNGNIVTESALNNKDELQIGKFLLVLLSK